MINMKDNVKRWFPDLYTQKGTLRVHAPYKFHCVNGHGFTKTPTTRIGGLSFGQIVCPKCGMKGTDNQSYNVWKRVKEGQIEREDFILTTIQNRTSVEYEELQSLVKTAFPDPHQSVINRNALGFLVYFSYLLVHKEGEEPQRLSYQLNPAKNAEKRLELIR